MPCCAAALSNWMDCQGALQAGRCCPDLASLAGRAADTARQRLFASVFDSARMRRYILIDLLEVIGQRALSRPQLSLIELRCLLIVVELAV